MYLKTNEFRSLCRNISLWTALETHVVITDKLAQKTLWTPALIGNMPRMLKVTLNSCSPGMVKKGTHVYRSVLINLLPYMWRSLMDYRAMDVTPKRNSVKPCVTLGICWRDGLQQPVHARGDSWCWGSRRNPWGGTRSLLLKCLWTGGAKPDVSSDQTVWNVQREGRIRKDWI